MPHKDPIKAKEYWTKRYWSVLAKRPRHPFGNRWIDITGQRFGMLQVMWPVARKKQSILWAAVCDCGSIFIANVADLRSGRTYNCGCMRGFKHGFCRVGRQTPEHKAYCHAKERCNNPNVKNYSHYGGRGIEFRFTSFDQFFSELGKRPSKEHSLDRINNNGHYEVGNVRWATRSQQVNNRRPTSEWNFK